ncbi:MAG: hypothetical protein COA79_01355 [Planctomycetota bacterium]|nr:MAG: hypothetical protein COA79_01355 [Planctomycetota bacterium]
MIRRPSSLLNNTIDNLSVELRLLIHLRYIEKIEISEISFIIDEEISLIKTKLKWALCQLIILLNEQGQYISKKMLTNLIRKMPLENYPKISSNFFEIMIDKLG